MSEALTGLGNRGNRKAKKAYAKHLSRAIENGPDKYAGAREGYFHFMDNPESYKKQAIIDAQEAGVEIDYPPYTERRHTSTEQQEAAQKLGSGAISGTYLMARRPTENRVNVGLSADPKFTTETQQFKSKD